MASKCSTVQEFNLEGIHGKRLRSPVICYAPPLSGCVQWSCSVSSEELGTFLPPRVISWGESKPTGEAEATPQECGTPTSPLNPVVSTYSCFPCLVA